MSRPLVFATRNKGKLVELRELLTGIDVLSVDEAAARLGRAIPEVDEDADTFAGNAAKKAREVSAITQLPALADDSGLEVDALGGAPGVYSARYAGASDSGGHGADAANNAKLIAALAGIPAAQRTARFRASLALADVHGPLGADLITADGTCEGVILDAPRGTGGFGYDPLFLFPDLGQTFAELAMSSRIKSDLSHRARAMQTIKPRLLAYLTSLVAISLVLLARTAVADPAKPAADAYTAALAHGRELLATKHTDDAIKAFEAALAAKPKDPTAMNELAGAEVLAGLPQSAAWAQKVIDAPGITPAMKAAAYYNLGRGDELAADTPGAFAAYSKSLALRENAETRSRLERLQGTATTELEGPFTAPVEWCARHGHAGSDTCDERGPDKDDVDHSLAPFTAVDAVTMDIDTGGGTSHAIGLQLGGAWWLLHVRDGGRSGGMIGFALGGAQGTGGRVLVRWSYGEGHHSTTTDDGFIVCGVSADAKPRCTFPIVTTHEEYDEARDAQGMPGPGRITYAFRCDAKLLPGDVLQVTASTARVPKPEAGEHIDDTRGGCAKLPSFGKHKVRF